MSNLDELTEIFNHNKDKRICVLGTTCTGKSTLINELNIGKDMDKEIFPLLTDKEKKYVCSTPWTEKIGNKMNELVRSRLTVEPGIPMFGTVVLKCDLIVYLHINDDLLLERTKLRNVNFEDAKNMQKKLEREIEFSNIRTIYVEVENSKKKVL